MEKNEQMKSKIENRYVDGLDGIRSAPTVEAALDKKNYGGKVCGMA
jgi:hypothetical protein